MMRKIVLGFVSVLLFLSFVPAAQAQGTILPEEPGGLTTEDCEELLIELSAEGELGDWDWDIQQILGCAIKTGRIELWMIPHFVVYAIETLLGVAGLIAVLFIVIGGYQYLVGGLTEEKDKAKKTIMYAIAGLVVALLAWALVNLIQLALTG